MATIPSSNRSTRTRRRAAHPGRSVGVPLLTALVLVVAACSSDDSASVTAERSSNRRPTTTEATSAPTTTEPTTTAPTTTEPTTATTAPGAPGGVPTTAPAAGGPVAEERTDPTWTLNAVEFRGQDGRRIAVTCAPGGTFGSVWGSGPYTDDSSICTAAVHGGLITQAGGGRVVVEIRPGEPTYLGTQANGVTSSDYGSWSGSFVLVASA